MSTCRVCAKPTTLACQRCQGAYYCGKEHQRADYAAHSQFTCALLSSSVPDRAFAAKLMASRQVSAAACIGNPMWIGAGDDENDDPMDTSVDTIDQFEKSTAPLEYVPTFEQEFERRFTVDKNDPNVYVLHGREGRGYRKGRDDIVHAMYVRFMGKLSTAVQQAIDQGQDMYGVLQFGFYCPASDATVDTIFARGFDLKRDKGPLPNGIHIMSTPSDALRVGAPSPAAAASLRVIVCAFVLTGDVRAQMIDVDVAHGKTPVKAKAVQINDPSIVVPCMILHVSKRPKGEGEHFTWDKGHDYPVDFGRFPLGPGIVLQDGQMKPKASSAIDANLRYVAEGAAVLVSRDVRFLVRTDRVLKPQPAPAPAANATPPSVFVPAKNPGLGRFNYGGMDRGAKRQRQEVMTAAIGGLVHSTAVGHKQAAADAVPINMNAGKVALPLHGLGVITYDTSANKQVTFDIPRALQRINSADDDHDSHEPGSSSQRRIVLEATEVGVFRITKRVSYPYGNPSQTTELEVSVTPDGSPWKGLRLYVSGGIVGITHDIMIWLTSTGAYRDRMDSRDIVLTVPDSVMDRLRSALTTYWLDGTFRPIGERKRPPGFDRAWKVFQYGGREAYVSDCPKLAEAFVMMNPLTKGRLDILNT